ncbi:60S ribosomal protein L23a, partial [Plecturocebus cupreus]
MIKVATALALWFLKPSSVCVFLTGLHGTTDWHCCDQSSEGKPASDLSHSPSFCFLHWNSSTTSSCPTKTLRLWRQPKYARKSTPRRNKHNHYGIKFPLTTESAMKKKEDNNTLVLTVDVKANKHQLKQAVKMLYDTDVAKVNTKKVLPGTLAHSCNPSTLGGQGGWITQGQEFETSLANVVKISTKNKKTSQVWWCPPVIPATWAAEAGESFEPRGGGCSELRSRYCTPAWATGRDSISKKKKRKKFRITQEEGLRHTNGPSFNKK